MSSRFPTLTLEGGLLAADLIDQVYDGTAPGQKPADFGFSPRTHLTDEIAFVWGEARSHWSAFQSHLSRLGEDNLATTETRVEWVTPLFSHLGYELTYNAKAHEVDGLTFAISHRAGSAEDAPPIHIVGWRQPLGARPPSGRPRLAPHSLLQEYLNRTEHLWGIVTNGQVLRILRDSALMRRQAYVEFDLRQIMEAGNFADFALLYRLIHRSRLPQGIGDAPQCLLEKYWSQTVEQGGRIRDRLRDGVEAAIKTLANGFLTHPRNAQLRERVKTGQLQPQEFYRQLLRLIYRQLFLMVAEERNLISDNPIYRDFYSMSRLRRLAEDRAVYSQHEDLWLQFQTLCRLFQDETKGALLEVPPLNGDLFDLSETRDLADTALTNHAFLSALWPLAMYRENERSPWRRVNYAALNVEELGSVYESLLEFQPVFREQAGRLTFEFRPGTERKTTGSYYTPPELVAPLIEHALAPILAEKLAAANTKEQRITAILGTRICDPACGSGHFLLAAARRLGKELAKIKHEVDEPAPEQLRECIREVITHCVYAVDKNPLAVDLCKVALWMEGHTIGKPLTFLDHRVKCGDSLVGVLDLNVLKQGIPDEAYLPIADDDKAVAAQIKKRNRDEQKGILDLPFQPAKEITGLSVRARSLTDIPDDTTDQIKRKSETYRSLYGHGTDYWRDSMACHLRTAAFFTPLIASERDGYRIPTTDSLRRYLESPGAADGRLIGAVGALAQRYRFFHWPLAFPEVFATGGFDVVLGNPPFMGGLKISSNFGPRYRHWLECAFDGFAGTADLCAAFFRRAFSLLKPGGRLGMIATNTLGQGDTRESGLAVILRQGGVITFARRFVKWPGQANVEVNLVALHKPDRSPVARRDSLVLDDQPVPFISSRLDAEPEQEPRRLRQNEDKAFQGSIVLGMGFVLEPDEAQALLAKDLRNAECLFPYLNGQDLNSDPEQRPSRYVICFHDWPLERARQYPDLIRIVETLVKPEREKLRDSIPIQAKRKKFWWQYGSPATELYRAIAPLRRVLVIARITEHFGPTFVPQGWVYNEKTIVFAFDDYFHFALLHSTLHEAWARKFSSTLESRFNYAPTDSFDTFPFPPSPAPEARAEAERLGEAYHEHRRQIMLGRQLGLTKTYNLFHNPQCTDADIVRLRELHAAMDRATLACYDWTDLDPGHGFHPNDRGQTRYTISPGARRELLHRLLTLNLETASREAASGKAHVKTRPRGRIVEEFDL